ncbi:MAG: hypothetical protein C0483_00150 [Pirellula sp.]|nr:hypothetical protein [Pirellula sp.]
MYMPEGSAVADFSAEDTSDTEKFMASFTELLKTRAEEGIGKGYAGAIISGLETLNTLMNEQQPWVLFSSHAQDIPYPDWIQKKVEAAYAKFGPSEAKQKADNRKKRAKELDKKLKAAKKKKK